MNKLKLRQELSKLTADANEAIGRVKEKKVEMGCQGGAVNWADLRCVEAQYVLSYHQGGKELYALYRVVIEEASPSCTPFQSAVRILLRKKGWDKIIVDTEW